MEQDRLHELAAGYALDALDDDERVAFEQHLAECEQCAADVQAFGETAALLAHAEEGPDPPAALRGRILEEARREQPHQSVVVLRPRRALRLTAIAAAAAVAAAIGLGLWGTSLSSSLDAERSALADSARAATILADEESRRLSLGEYGQVVRGARRRSGHDRPQPRRGAEREDVRGLGDRRRRPAEGRPVRRR